jgi:hypothetical protein
MTVYEIWLGNKETKSVFATSESFNNAMEIARSQIENHWTEVYVYDPDVGHRHWLVGSPAVQYWRSK